MEFREKDCLIVTDIPKCIVRGTHVKTGLIAEVFDRDGDIDLARFQMFKTLERKVERAK